MFRPYTVIFEAANGEVVSCLQEGSTAQDARRTVEATGHRVLRVDSYPPFVTEVFQSPGNTSPG